MCVFCTVVYDRHMSIIYNGTKYPRRMYAWITNLEFRRTICPWTLSAC